MRKIFLYILLASLFTACTNNNTGDATEEESTKEEVAEAITGDVYFANINDGDTLTSPFLMKMAVTGMQVEPKGESREGFGHHHLLINDGPVDAGIVIIADSTHIHYGGGQVFDSLALDPGNYKLTLQFGDGLHVSYGEAWSSTVNVVVQ